VECCSKIVGKTKPKSNLILCLRKYTKNFLATVNL
jgi:hypothetical protein